MAEHVTLTLPVYRTPGGRHTCAVDVAAGLCCPLLERRYLGHACGWPGLKSRDPWVDDYQSDYTTPVPDCPVAAALAPVVSSPHD